MNLVDTQIERFRATYLESRKPIRVSFRFLCSEWPWARRSDVYTHSIHRYPAKILPHIPIFFLTSETFASSNEAILDPFAGTGTVLLESIIHPFIRRNAIGVEINPLARLIAKVKTTPLDITKLEKEAKVLFSKIESFAGNVDIPKFPNRDLWFSPRIQRELAKIKLCIEEVKDVDFKDFFLVCLSSIIRDVSFADPKIAPPIVLRPENFAKNPERQRKVVSLLRRKKVARPLMYFRRQVEKNMSRIKTLNQIEELHSGKIKAEIVWDDARHLRKAKLIAKGGIDKSLTEPLEDESIGLVVTSPPYINAQKYVRTTKFELFWLGLAKENELIELDKMFIGTEKVFSNEYNTLYLTGISSADDAIQRIFEKDRRRAAIVSRYFRDMRQVMEEVYRVLKKDGRFVLVVGDNTICGVKVRNHEILTNMATQHIGFEIDIMLVDKIRSRGMITKRHETGGLVPDDWVIVLRKKG